MSQRTVDSRLDGFADEYADAIQGLRSALEELVRSAGGDPTRPQELARTFGLNKNLTWKVSRLIGTGDPVEALRFVPGSAGLRILREAIGPRGDREATLLCEAAESRFDFMLARHAGDRASLEMLVQELAGNRVLPEPIEAHRKQAFLGNSGVWGVQAAAQITLNAIAPSRDDPDRVDVVVAGGLIDFRRMRSDTRWLLFARQNFEPREGRAFPSDDQPLEPPPGGPDAAPLLRDFCSAPVPQILRREVGDELRYELPPGPVGNTALTTAVFGGVKRSMGDRVNRGPDEKAYGSVGLHLLTPVEHAQIDLLLHEDLGWTSPPELVVLGRMDGRPEFAESARAGRLLPIAEQVVRLGR
ncbi:MAG TPA: hypothetical protein VJP77_08570, partial [Planctomycetota bacterium]|nr:hypothetical protein [Planctomycetota bacterium]